MNLSRTLSVTGVLLLATFAFAQPGNSDSSTTKLKEALAQRKTEKKSELELALEQALKNNPELRVAMARLALAEEEVRQAKLAVAQKIAAAYASLAAEQLAETELKRQLTLYQSLRAKGGATAEEVAKVESSLAQIKAKVEASKKQLEFLQGKGEPERKTATYSRPDNESTGAKERILGLKSGVDSSSTLTAVAADSREKLRRAMKKKVTVTAKSGTLGDLLAMIKKSVPEIRIHTLQENKAGGASVFDLDFDNVTIYALLQFLEDQSNQQVIVREYGLLIVSQDKVPPGALTLATLMREPEAAKAATREIRGKITNVSPNGEHYAIGIGSKAGVAMGMTMEVYRTSPPTYVGKLKIVKVELDLSVGQVIGTFKQKAKEGDIVINNTHLE